MMRRSTSIAWFAVVLLLVGCSGPSGSETVRSGVPPEDTFLPISAALEVSCGTLDCHGSSARNLRIYGIDGLRLDPAGITGDQSTTLEEVQATYAAVVSIQPEVLSKIVAERGAKPERWLLIGKGRETLAHKGGARLHAGDDTDTCITSWLANAVDQQRCESAAALSPPSGDAF